MCNHRSKIPLNMELFLKKNLCTNNVFQFTISIPPLQFGKTEEGGILSVIMLCQNTERKVCKKKPSMFALTYIECTCRTCMIRHWT